MKTISFLFFALLLCSCTISTPQTRIEQNPALYQALSPEHQALAQQGQITKNMPSAGVFLAWGQPASKRSGHKDGKNFLQWDYNSLHPVVSRSFSYGYGYSPYRRYGRYGRYGGRYNSFGVGQSVDYIPYRARSVAFHKDRVSSWEVANPPY